MKIIHAFFHFSILYFFSFKQQPDKPKIDFFSRIHIFLFVRALTFFNVPYDYMMMLNITIIIIIVVENFLNDNRTKFHKLNNFQVWKTRKKNSRFFFSLTHSLLIVSSFSNFWKFLLWDFPSKNDCLFTLCLCFFAMMLVVNIFCCCCCCLV